MPTNGTTAPAPFSTTASAGALVTPAGAFIRGQNAYTNIVNPINVPNPGETFLVELRDARWVVPGQMVFVGGAGAGGSAAAFLVTAVSGNQVTLLNPDRHLNPPIDYSTQEQETGLVWIDGRSVYQKSYSVTTMTSGVHGDMAYVTLALGLSGFASLIDAVVVLSAGSTWQVKLPYSDNVGWVALRVGENPPASGNVFLWVTQGTWELPDPLNPTPGIFPPDISCFVTLKYLKTP